MELDAALDVLVAVIAVQAVVVDAPALDARVSADPDGGQCLAAARVSRRSARHAEPLSPVAAGGATSVS